MKSEKKPKAKPKRDGIDQKNHQYVSAKIIQMTCMAVHSAYCVCVREKGSDWGEETDEDADRERKRDISSNRFRKIHFLYEARTDRRKRDGRPSLLLINEQI